MNKIIIFLTLNFIYSLSCFAKNDKIDSLEKVVTHNISDFEEQINNMNLRLIEHETKEDFFSAALSDQATRFSLIAGSLLALLGGISYGVFKLELHKLKKDNEEKLKVYQETLKTEIEKFDYISEVAHRTTGNSNRLIADNYESREMYVSQFYYLLFSALNHHKNFILKSKEKEACECEKKIEKFNDTIESVKSVVLNNLNNASSCFKENIKTDPSKKESFRENSGKTEEIFECLDELLTSKDSEIKKITTAIRYELNTFIE